MKTWKRENYTVVEADFNYDLHCFEIYRDGELLTTVYPGSIEEMEEGIRDLDAGEGVEFWEDKNGNSVSNYL